MNAGDFGVIEARTIAATEGPWTYRDIIGGLHNVTRNAWDVASCGAGDLDPDDGDRDDQAARNAEFIAHSRADVETLLAAVRERDNTIAKVHELMQSWDNGDYDDMNQFSPHHFVRHLRAALDPQETP